MISDENNLILLSLGSNAGDKIKYLKDAYRILTETEVIESAKISSFYETEPVGFKEQPFFINAAVAGYTSLNPLTLLESCKAIEKQLGRISREKWHEREIDIDILLFGSLIFHTNNLIIPHPAMHLRKFVLIPAAEISPSIIHPVLYKSILELLNEIEDNSIVRLFEFKV
jgi:2-amino-4-hydroxy-6-hydroxymethyldihydropteridine diphosphokinase